jgi:choline dehydrogenase
MAISRGLVLAGFALATVANAQSANATYEYIVVGSGPGGGPLAANLARAGHSVLLLEAGDDQGSNPNISQILNFNLAGKFFLFFILFLSPLAAPRIY